MSSHSNQTTCPNCHKQADANIETRPFDMYTMSCSHCGFTVSPFVQFMNLEELNEYRADRDLEPLTELPPQDEDLQI